MALVAKEPSKLFHPPWYPAMSPAKIVLAFITFYLATMFEFCSFVVWAIVCVVMCAQERIPMCKTWMLAGL